MLNNTTHTDNNNETKQPIVFQQHNSSELEPTMLVTSNEQQKAPSTVKIPDANIVSSKSTVWIASAKYPTPVDGRPYKICHPLSEGENYHSGEQLEAIIQNIKNNENKFAEVLLIAGGTAHRHNLAMETALSEKDAYIITRKKELALMEETRNIVEKLNFKTKVTIMGWEEALLAESPNLEKNSEFKLTYHPEYLAHKELFEKRHDANVTIQGAMRAALDARISSYINNKTNKLVTSPTSLSLFHSTYLDNKPRQEDLNNKHLREEVYLFRMLRKNGYYLYYPMTINGANKSIMNALEIALRNSFDLDEIDDRPILNNVSINTHPADLIRNSKHNRASKTFLKEESNHENYGSILPPKVLPNEHAPQVNNNNQMPAPTTVQPQLIEKGKHDYVSLPNNVPIGANPHGIFSEKTTSQSLINNQPTPIPSTTQPQTECNDGVLPPQPDTSVHPTVNHASSQESQQSPPLISIEIPICNPFYKQVMRCYVPFNLVPFFLLKTTVLNNMFFAENSTGHAMPITPAIDIDAFLTQLHLLQKMSPTLEQEQPPYNGSIFQP